MPIPSNSEARGCSLERGLSTSQDDTVHYNQGDEQTEGGVDVRQESLDDELQHGDEGRDDNDEHGDAHLVGGDLGISRYASLEQMRTTMVAKIHRHTH